MSNDLLHDFRIRVNDRLAYDPTSLRKNDFSVAAQAVRLEATLPDHFAGDLILTHEAMGEVVSRERVRVAKEGRVEAPVRLLRGRNTLVLACGPAPETRFRLDLFHRSSLRDWVESMIRALVLVLVVKTFVVQAFFIPTESMKPTFQIGDFLLVDKVTNLFRNPSPGDVVVFEYPEDPTKNFIKRLVAVEGDRIAHCGKNLIHNGKALDEPYARYLKGEGSPQESDPLSFSERKLAQGTLWVMGDNRNNSRDSRFWGQLETWRLIGRAWGTYWPLRRTGLISHRFGTLRSTITDESTSH